MVLGHPAYHFLTAEGRWSTVFADDGTGLESLTKDQALASAKEFSRGTSASYLGRLHLDQWTVSSALESFRPLHRVIIHDTYGTELYISDRTGEVGAIRQQRSVPGIGSVQTCIGFIRSSYGSIERSGAR
jgi:hypothetical protein